MGEKIFPERHEGWSQEKSCGAAVTTVQSAACNAIVLVPGINPHHKYNVALRGFLTAGGAAEMWVRVSKIRITFLKISAALLLKIE